MSEPEVCQTCSVKLNTPAGVVEITDDRKWMTTPIPCPECEGRTKAKLAELGKRLAAERERAVLDALCASPSKTNKVVD